MQHNLKSKITLKSIGACMRKEREEKGMTQKDVAEGIKTRIATISNIESGKEGYRVVFLIDYCNLLKIPLPR